VNHPVYPFLPGHPPYVGDPLGGCDPYPDGAVVGELRTPAYPWISEYTDTRELKPAYGQGFCFLLPNEPLPRACRSAWYVEVFGRERLYNPTLNEQVGDTSQDVSLKVVIRWTSSEQEPHELVADVGTGLVAILPPCTLPSGSVLIPNSSQVPSIQAELPSPDYDELADLELRTTICARATPWEYNVGASTAQFTQSLLIPDGSVDPILHPVPAFASEIQVAASPLSGAAPAILANPLYYDFVGFVTAGGVPVQLGQGGTVAALPASGVDNGRSEIPGNAKFVRIWPSAPNSPATSVTLTYTLIL